jgi:tetratricopeptide (TPR) repeat protein
VLPDGAEDDPISAATSAFARGLIRRGIAVLNRAIRDGRASPAAWLLKSRVMNSIGYNRSAAEMIGRALNTFDRPADRIELHEEWAYLLAECGRGEEALRSANAAVALGSGSLRTHYLRGRALALVGRLNEARDEMTSVLGLDPDNADARRGLGMIDAALRATARKPWWKVW